MESVYSREVHLCSALNQFLITELKLPPSDYASKLTMSSLLNLKSVLSHINNLITLKLTLGLADWICDKYNLDVALRAQLRRIVLATKPNANGFDLYLGVPVAFVAEVKCNLPINGHNRYGAQQKKGIIADIESLLTGKRRASIMSQKVLKFMAFLDLPEIREANEHLVKTTPDLLAKLLFLNPDQKPRDLKVVYGVYIKVES